MVPIRRGTDQLVAARRLFAPFCCDCKCCGCSSEPWIPSQESLGLQRSLFKSYLVTQTHSKFSSSFVWSDSLSPRLCLSAAVAVPSPSNIGYRPGDMALLGLIMAALLVLSLIVIGFLISRLWKENTSLEKICEVSLQNPKDRRTVKKNLPRSFLQTLFSRVSEMFLWTLVAFSVQTKTQRFGLLEAKYKTLAE